MQENESLASIYKRWLLDTARTLRSGDTPPGNREEARRRGEQIRSRMRASELDALIPDRNSVSLDVQILGKLERDGYHIEPLTFRTRPSVYVTAHAYVPAKREARVPAVLAVHGHWQGARRDPVVQSRCIGLAKLGFFVLALDAWGAGERGTRIGQNEYHGGLLGASLWPVGTPLHGLQLHDNIRALDYLETRPEVDAARIGCTGASGGGNQTTILSAFDERIKCAVPVCSVGTFADYQNAACCVDEVLMDALTYAEEGDLLGMVAPRALMVITASKDSQHFGPGSAKTALERAQPYFRATAAEDRVKHVVFESGHDYSKPMREAMYGWMSKWLKEEGDGSPIPEPAFKTEDPEALRCYSALFRPAKVMTTVRWAKQQGQDLVAATASPRPDQLQDFQKGKAALISDILRLSAQTGSELPLSAISRTDPGKKVALLLHTGGQEAARESALAQSLKKAGVSVSTLELRGCGALTLPNQGLGDSIPDHNLVEWSMWIGRPLLGQWVADIMRLVRHIKVDRSVALVGWREAGLAALLASALDPKIKGVATIETLASYITDTPPHNQRMVVFQPDILKVGDVPQIAALSAPRPVVLANPQFLDGSSPSSEQVDSTFAYTRSLYEALREANDLTIRGGMPDEEVAKAVTGWLR